MVLLFKLCKRIECTLQNWLGTIRHFTQDIILTIYMQGRLSLFLIVILYPENCRHIDSKKYVIYLVSFVRLIGVLMFEIILLPAKIYT